MSEVYIRLFSLVLCLYACFAIAFILVGEKIDRVLVLAFLPAIVGVATYYLEKSKLEIVCILVIAFIVIFELSYFCKKDYCVSSLICLLAFSFCLTSQLVVKVFGNSFITLVIYWFIEILIPTFLILFKITIFSNNQYLTVDQKKKMFTQRFYLFPLVILLLVWQVIFLSMNSQNKMTLIVYTIIFQIVVLSLLSYQVKSMHEKVESIIDKQYQSELLNFMQVIRSQRHDFNFHTQTIYSLIETGQYDECKKYVQAMMKEVKSTNDILPLHQVATSALLNTFKEMALQKGLRLDIEIHDNLQFISTTVYETNTILGNLLQNAIDELELHPENKDRIIKLLIIKRGKYNIIKVTNQCHLPAEQMSKIFIAGYSTKTSHEGLGLANALRVAENNGGSLYPEFEEDHINMIAKIPLKK